MATPLHTRSLLRSCGQENAFQVDQLRVPVPRKGPGSKGLPSFHRGARKASPCYASGESRATAARTGGRSSRHQTHAAAGATEPPPTRSESAYLAENMKKYEELKSETFAMTAKAGGAIALYSLLTSGPNAAASAALGAASSLLYMRMLQDYVDSLGSPDVWVTPLPPEFTEVQPWKRAKVNIAENPFQMMTNVTHPFRQALGHKRLLILVALAAGGAGVNAAADWAELPVHCEWAFVFFGFLSYKFSFLLYIYKNDVRAMMDRFIKDSFQGAPSSLDDDSETFD